MIEDGRPLDRDGYNNPASPAVLTNTAPWDISRASSATPTAASSMAPTTPQGRAANLPGGHATSGHTYTSSQSSAQSSATPTRATYSPTQTRTPIPSASDLLTRVHSSQYGENGRHGLSEDSALPRSSVQTDITLVGADGQQVHHSSESSGAQRPPVKEK